MHRPLVALLLPVVEALSDEESAIWCPADQVGTQCPEPSWWSFYKCCGNLHKTCCSHIRLWVLVLIVALPIVLLIPAIAYLLRRLFCHQEDVSRTPAITVRPPEAAAGRKDTSL